MAMLWIETDCDTIVRRITSRWEYGSRYYVKVDTPFFFRMAAYTQECSLIQFPANMY